MSPQRRNYHSGVNITVYGIPNCDTVKKARSWLDENSVDYQFHDFKKLGVPAQRLEAWVAAAGWEKILNRKGTTWRKLDVSVQDGVIDAASAEKVMLSQPSVIKRPVTEWGSGITVGFDPQQWAAFAGK